MKKKQMLALARDLASSLSWVSTASRPSRLPTSSKTVVTFHRVLPKEYLDQYPIPGLAVTPEEFDHCLDHLTQHYSCKTVSELLSSKSGQSSRAPGVAVTFDDGQLDNLEFAEPILAKYGVSATFFVVPKMSEAKQQLWHDRLGFAALVAHANPDGSAKVLSEFVTVEPSDYVDAHEFVSALLTATKSLSPTRRDEMVSALFLTAHGEIPPWSRLLTREEIVGLAQRGHEIGSHTNSHALLPQCDDETLADELNGSKQMLEEWLGHPVRSFCYPNGDHDERTAQAVQKAGYHSAVTTQFGVNSLSDDAFRLRRFDITSRSLRDRKGRLSRPRLGFALSRLRRER